MKKNNQNSVGKEVMLWVEAIVSSVIIVALIIAFVGRIVDVSGSSMMPYFSDGDKVITINAKGNLKYGDVVAIKRKNDTSLIKRIIATEGQTVNINYETGEVMVDGTILDEPFLSEPTCNDLGMSMPTIVPQGCVFVMGDNRNHSDDSRNPAIGMINTKNISGKIVFRIMPFDSFGKISLEDAKEATKDLPKLTIRANNKVKFTTLFF
ncbi:MAG: signal peptidase I [Oscillospiraceae bacterium]